MSVNLSSFGRPPWAAPGVAKRALLPVRAGFGSVTGLVENFAPLRSAGCAQPPSLLTMAVTASAFASAAQAAFPGISEFSM